MLIPGGAVQLFGMLFGGWVATRWPGTRCVVMVVANTVCIIGSGLLVGLPNDNKVSFLYNVMDRSSWIVCW
jgi:dipeptide/tripeptide permease